MLVVAVSFGLVYDNLILSVGGFLDGGQLLYALSVPRFILHQLVLPGIIWVTFEQVRLSGARWAQRILAERVIILLSIVVVILGIVTRLIPMHLQLVEMGGINRYMNKGASGPPIVSIASIGFAGAMGLFLWRKSKWPWTFLTALMVFVGEGIPIELIRRVVGSGAEILFIAALLTTEQRVLIQQTDYGPPRQVTPFYSESDRPKL
jgi:hypothetical protein